MRKWQSYYEVLYFPLIVLFVACVLKGASGLILSPSFMTYFGVDNQWIILLSEMFRYLGSYLIEFFPFLVLIKLLTKRYEASTPVFVGISSYVIFHVGTLFFADHTLPSSVFSPLLGISVDASKLSLAGSGMRYPLVTGIFSVFVISELTRYFYTNSRRRSSRGLFAFINRDAYAFLATCLFALLSGILTALVWPYVTAVLYGIFGFIARDITNPMSLFLYGVFERLMALTCTDNIIHGMFWFGEYGGSWIHNGITYLGDISVWTAQQAAGVYNTGFGRFLAPYYIQNIFIIPAVIIATFRTFTDKMEKDKHILFLIFTVVFSGLCGSILPIEIYLVITAPLFYVFHLFGTGILYAILAAFKVAIGYSYTGTVAFATPGNVFDLLMNIRNKSLSDDLIKLFIIGILFAALYYIAMMFYYRKACVDILQTGKKEKLLDSFILAIGGVENIDQIYSSPTKIILRVNDRSLLNFAMLQDLGAYKIIETRTTYDISFGAISYFIAQEMNERMKKELV